MMKRMEWAGLIIVLLGVLTMMAVRNLPWRLEDYDQAKQAYAALDARLNNQWLFQGLPYGGFATKPPLTTWLQAASTWVIGERWALAWRLPSFLAALALLALICRAGWRMGGPQVAAIGAGAFGFNMLTMRIATLVRTDMLLALFCFVPGLMILEHVQTRKKWTRGEKGVMFLLVLAGVFTKGHAVYAFLLPGLLLYAVQAKRRYLPNHAWCGWMALLVPLAILAALVAALAAADPAFFRQIVQGEIMVVFNVGPVETKTQPFYYYWTHLLHKWAPWSLLLLLPLFRRRDAAKTNADDPAFRWLLCWVLGGLVVMSLVPQKRVDRIYPVLPALCLLLMHMAARWQAGQTARAPSHKVVTGTLVLAALLWPAYGIGQIVQDYRQGAHRLKHLAHAMMDGSYQQRVKLVPPLAEGFACYLKITDALTWEEAVDHWHQTPGAVILVSDRFLDEHAGDLQDARVLMQETNPDRKIPDTYFLLERQPGEPTPQPSS